MRRSLRSLAEKSYDLLIIGGGINGAGIASEAAGRGLKTLLLERRDFSSGTTSRSTKLIHGGLRYLEHGEFGLVFESLREREALLQRAPHLVRPLPFLILLHRDGPYRPFRVRLGLTVYDLLSLGKSVPSHRALTIAEVREREPALVVEGVKAAFLYFDAQVPYPERLVLENVRAAEARGADVLNYAEVIGLILEAGVVCGARVRDRVSGEEGVVRARVVVNAAGPWVDAVCRFLPRAIPRQIGGTKGSHLVAPNRWGLRHALYAAAHMDGRPFFIVPWHGHVLIGTTDIRYEGDADQVQADDEEVAYLLAEARRLLGPELRRHEVLYAYSGVRPLPYQPGVPEGAITRRHIIRDHERADGLAGFISIIGGKITPYRHLAEEVVTLVCRKLRIEQRALTKSRCEPLPGGAPVVPRDVEEAARALGLTSDTVAHLLALYGSLSWEVLELVERERTLAERLCPHHPDIAAQIVYAVEREHAVHLADIFLRRTAIGWGRCLGLACAATAARYLGWDAPRAQEEITAYRDELARMFRVFAPPLGESVPSS